MAQYSKVVGYLSRRWCLVLQTKRPDENVMSGDKKGGEQVRTEYSYLCSTIGRVGRRRVGTGRDVFLFLGENHSIHARRAMTP